MSPEDNADGALEAFVAFFGALAPADLDRLDGFYAPQARFVDPFNDVVGLETIRAIFAEMFERLDDPRFVIGTHFARGRDAFVAWDFSFGTGRAGSAGRWLIHGSTLLRFDGQGRVLEHRDYWDAAGQLYERLPLVGILIRGLRRRLQHR